MTPNSSSCGVGSPRVPLIHVRIFDWCDLVQVYIGDHDCCDLTGSEAMSYPEVNILQLSSPFASPYILYICHSEKFPSLGWWRLIQMMGHSWAPGYLFSPPDRESLHWSLTARWSSWPKLGAAHSPWVGTFCCPVLLSLLKVQITGLSWTILSMTCI